MNLKGVCQIEEQGVFSQEWMEHLYLLYFPLIGMDACLLYGLLYAWRGETMDNMQLYGATKLSQPRFKSARRKLEEFGLLRTFYDGTRRRWLYILKPPLEPVEFLAHDVWSRMFLAEQGPAQFDRLKERYLPAEPPAGMEEVTEPFDPIHVDRIWTADLQRTYDRVQVELDPLRDLHFDFAKFFVNLERVFPEPLRTPANLKRIAELASQYGISEEKMRTYMSRVTNTKHTKIDLDLLADIVAKGIPDAKASEANPYDMSPQVFLMSRQDNIPLSFADKRLIEKLRNEYRFTDEMINILLDYCLRETNQALSNAYAEKVATTWVRRKIDSPEKALAFLKEDQRSSGQRRKPAAEAPALPEWYHEQTTHEANPELMEKALALQEELRRSRQS